MTLDIDHLRGWIGRTEEAADTVTPRLAAEFAATFAPHLPPLADGDVSPAMHWCLAPPIRPMGELGPDGHAARGEFLPPVPLPRRMWAGGEVESLAPLRIGDRVVRRSTIEDVSAKTGRSGTLCFVAVRHVYETERGVAVRERHDIVYREAAAPGAAAPPAAAAAPSAPPASDLDWQVETSPVFLFRYSAITFNGHRIHYDLPYVTGQEGYAGLVVHGPVQATLLLHLATALGGRVPPRFTYRGLSPLTAGPAFTVAGRRDGEAIRCWTRSADGRTCMDAQASG